MMIAYPTDDGGTVWVTGGDAWQPHAQEQASGDASEPKPYAEHKHKG